MPHDPTERLAQLVDLDGVKVPSVMVEVFKGRTEQEDPQVLDESMEPKADLKYFKNFEEFVMFMLFVGAKHSFPEASNEDAIQIATIMANSIRRPNARPMWNRVVNYFNRLGMSQTLVRISMELLRGQYKTT